MMLKAANKRS
jgi:enoyl-CoA hydratase/carnithine racemase